MATRGGRAYAAFVTDAFSRRIVGWHASNSLWSGPALDALEQVICERREGSTDGLIDQSGRGVRYLSIP